MDAIADTAGGDVATKLMVKITQGGSFGYTAVLPRTKLIAMILVAGCRCIGGLLRRHSSGRPTCDQDDGVVVLALPCKLGIASTSARA